MKFRLPYKIALTIASFILCSTSAATTQAATIRFLGYNHDRFYDSGGEGLAISSDGSMVAGWSTSPTSGSHLPTYWDQNGELKYLASTGDRVTALSPDGKTAFVTSSGGLEIVDLARGVTTRLPVPGSYISFVAASPNGRNIVATDGYKSYLSIDRGPLSARPFYIGTSSEPFKASSVLDDGTVFGGQKGTLQAHTQWGVGNFAVLSLKNGVVNYFAPISGDVNATTQDGRFIVGGGNTLSKFGSLLKFEPYISTASGQVTYLGDLPGGDNSGFATDVSDDGTRVVGQSSVEHGGGAGPQGFDGLAFLWEAGHGLVSLNQIAINSGINLGSCNLVKANSISGNGRYVTGGAICTSGPNAAGYAVYAPYVLDFGSVSAVPEPQIYALLLAGLGLIAGAARRSSK